MPLLGVGAAAGFYSRFALDTSPARSRSLGSRGDVATENGSWPPRHEEPMMGLGFGAVAVALGAETLLKKPPLVVFYLTRRDATR